MNRCLNHEANLNGFTFNNILYLSRPQMTICSSITNCHIAKAKKVEDNERKYEAFISYNDQEEFRNQVRECVFQDGARLVCGGYNFQTIYFVLHTNIGKIFNKARPEIQLHIADKS